MRRLRLVSEDGIALVMATGVMLVLSISFATVIYFTTSNSRQASHGKAGQTAYAIAEAGLNNAAAQLQAKYPSGWTSIAGVASPAVAGTTAYSGGSATWSGTFTADGSGYGGTWTLTSTGTVGNPTGPGAANLTRTITALADVAQATQMSGTPTAWNYVYSGGTSCTTIDNTVTFTAPLYTPGDLCLENQGKILQPATFLAVGGKVTIASPQGTIGTSAQKIQEVHIAGGCKYRNNPFQPVCIPNNNLSNVYAQNFYTSMPTPPITPPVPDWPDMYNQAAPGPWHGCVVASGTPPTFDVTSAGAPVAVGGTPDGLNNNVSSVFNLTPTSSYTCESAGGELSWNAATRVLTVGGIIYIDGSITVDTLNQGVARYSGSGVIYTSGTVAFENNSTLCAKVSGSTCDFDGWQPGNGDPILIFESNGLGTGGMAGDSIQVNASTVQAGFYGTNAIEIKNSSNVQGPMISPTVIVPHNSSAQAFSGVISVPAGTSGTTYTHTYSLGPLRNVTY